MSEIPATPAPGTLAYLLRLLPDEPAKRGRAFERLCKWFLENDSVYSSRLRKVWLWDEWPGRWGADAGIDLVAEEMDGSLWAIQAKAYSPHRQVTKADVDTFLAESSRPHIGYRLLIATTDKLGDTAKRTLKQQAVQVGVLLLGDLAGASVEWPRSFDHLRPGRPKPKKPRPHQRRAALDVLNGFAGNDRGQLVMACGTGKTLTALDVSRKLEARRILYLVPSLSLLSQVIREWTTNSKGPLEFMAVCSDDSVVGEDDLVESTSELGIPVTTQPEEIGAFLRARLRPSQQRIVFSTYQSSSMVGKAQAAARTPGFDLIVADEAHRLAGDIAAPYSAVLRGDLKGSKRLFMTATPRYFTGRIIRAAKERDLEIASMDSERLFGPRFHTLSFGRAISDGLLTDYQVVIVGVDDAEYREWAERGRLVTADGLTTLDARSLAASIGLAKAMRRFDIRRAISFHGRVKAARHFAEQFPKIVQWMPPQQRPSGPVHADHIAGTMSAGERRVRLDALANPAGRRAILTNARCLTEGIDVPALDGVAFVDPRSSEVDVVQAVGRAIRLSSEKKVGTIVIPVFLGSSEDAELALDESAFKPVWDVLKALRAHDEDLAKRLDNLRRELGRRRGRIASALPEKIILDLPSRVSREFSRAIDARLVERTTTSWNEWFGVLQSFAEREGHARVVGTHVEDGYRLGQWVVVQRQLRQTMGEERRLLLDSLPGWSWNPNEDSWEEGYSALLSYLAAKGDARVPKGVQYQGFSLSVWVEYQRSQREVMSEERRHRLESLPGWSWGLRADAWEEGFRALESFVRREGHARVSQQHQEDRFFLGRWVGKQRARRDSLPQDRRERLEALPGWSWDVLADAWEEGFRLLAAFVAENGHARVPASRIGPNGALATWVMIQRKAAGSMSAARRGRLEALPGWSWDAREDKWQRAFEALLAYVKREGHAQVPSRHREGSVRLGTWVASQRTNRSSLSQERAALLEGVPGWAWSAHGQKWEEGFRILQIFVAREGHARVSQQATEEGFKLGTWVAVQRRNRASISADRRARLETLPGWSWSTRGDESWEQGFIALTRYVDREGSAKVPKGHMEHDGLKLGAWVETQRRRKGELSASQRTRLESLSGWSWNRREDAWVEACRCLVLYADREGHSRVPFDHVEAGFKLGAWVVAQRRARGSLSPERQKVLESVQGWTWDPHEDAWDEAFSLLQAYVRRTGTAKVPQAHTEQGFRLGAWVTKQRQRRDSLLRDRAHRLESLSGWTWDPLGDAWEVGFKALATYSRRKGTSRVPVNHVEDGFNLGRWVRKQRQRRDAMPLERKKRLQALPGWTWS